MTETDTEYGQPADDDSHATAARPGDPGTVDRFDPLADQIPTAEQPRWWGVEHWCGGSQRTYPTLHWADEPEVGVGPRRAFDCDACGERYAFYEEEPSINAKINHHITTVANLEDGIRG